MIKVNVKKKENSISEITITGHAYYDESGKDIVCASTSSIAITTVNAILRLNSQALRYEEGEGSLKIYLEKHTKTIDTLLVNMVELLQELEQDYPSYIKVSQNINK